MLKLLVILFVIKLYARTDIFKTRDDLISFELTFLETCLPQYAWMLH